MLLSFFNKNTFANIIGVVFFALVLWLPAFISPPALMSVSFMPIYKTIVGVFGNNSFLLVFFSFVCVLTQAFYFNFLVVKHNLFAKNGYMAAFIYSTLMSCSPTFLFFHPFTIGGFFVLLQIDLLITTYKKQDARTELFYVGLLCSLLTLFYNSYSLFLLFAFIAIALMRPLNWRDYFICFMGFLLPFLFVFTYYFWADSIGYFTITLLNFDFFDFVFEKISVEQWLFLCGFFLLVFFAVIRIITRGLTIKTMLVRKTFSLLFWLLLCGLAIGLFINLPNMSSFSVVCIPITVFLSNQYLNSKKLFWSELLFGLFFLGCVFKNALFFGLF